MPSPTISVIIPVYNSERYLAEAIESVLAQTLRPLEIIIVDDGSTDGTQAAAKRFGDPVRYVFQAHQNAPVARNQGIRLAQGQYLAFLDADDLWLPEKLSHQTKALAENSDTDAVFTHLLHFISPELTAEEASRFYCPPDPMPGLTAQTFLGKRELFQSVGLFNETLVTGDFLDWYERALWLRVRMEMLPDVLMKRRIHLNNLTTTKKAEVQQSYLRALKDSLDRRRATKQ